MTSPTQAKIWSSFPEAARDQMDNKQRNLEKSDITIVGRQEQAFHERVSLRHDEPIPIGTDLQAARHQKEEAAMGQGRQETGSRKVEAVADQHEEIADQGQERRLPNHLL